MVIHELDTMTIVILSLIFRLIDVWLMAAFQTHVVNTPCIVFPTLHHQILKYLHISAIMIFFTSGNELRVATTWLITNAVHNWQTRRRLEKQTMMQLATIVLDILLSLSHDQTQATTKSIMAVKWQVRIIFILNCKLNCLSLLKSETFRILGIKKHLVWF